MPSIESRTALAVARVGVRDASRGTLPDPLQRWADDFATLAGDDAASHAWDAYRRSAAGGASTTPRTPRVLAEVDIYEAALVAMRALARRAPPLARTLATAPLPESGEGVEARLCLGAALDELGDLQGAAVLLQQARQESGVDARSSLHLVVLVALGRVLVMQGDDVQACAVLLEGVALARQHGARRQEAKLLGNLGFLHGEHDGIAYEAYTRRALEIGRELGDARLVAHSLCNLGGALCQLGRTGEAQACYAEGLPLAESLEWAHSVALFQAGQGGMYATQGDLDASVACYDCSLEWFRGAGDSFQVARLEMTVGRHLARARRFARAVPYLERSLALCKGETFRNTAWQAHALLAEARDALGDLRGALAALRASIELRESMFEARVADRLRLLALHVEAEKATREAAWERERNAELEALARTDALTKLHNRRHVDEFFATELSRARRYGRPLSLALLDIDYFKAVNDQHGHEAGDQVLVELARRLQGRLRGHDVAARWGGEEFCVILPDTDAEGARTVVARLFDAVRAQPFETRAGSLPITVSVGVTSLHAEDSSIDDLLRRADEALYRAKRTGRDRVICGDLQVG